MFVVVLSGYPPDMRPSLRPPRSVAGNRPSEERPVSHVDGLEGHWKLCTHRASRFVVMLLDKRCRSATQCHSLPPDPVSVLEAC